MNRKTIFTGALVLTVVFLIAAVYYLIPGYYHLLATHDYTSAQPKHIIGFLALALIAGAIAAVNRPKSGSDAPVQQA